MFDQTSKRERGAESADLRKEPLGDDGKCADSAEPQAT